MVPVLNQLGTREEERDSIADVGPPSRKFGKQIQKRQLEVPEYAASFVNYKALKKVRYIGDFCRRGSETKL